MLPPDCYDALVAEFHKNDPGAIRPGAAALPPIPGPPWVGRARLCESGVRAWVVFGDKDDVGLFDDEPRTRGLPSRNPRLDSRRRPLHTEHPPRSGRRADPRGDLRGRADDNPRIVVPLLHRGAEDDRSSRSFETRRRRRAGPASRQRLRRRQPEINAWIKPTEFPVPVRAGTRSLPNRAPPSIGTSPLASICHSLRTSGRRVRRSGGTRPSSRAEAPAFG